jgi:diadenosine tetraphosphate (Ap4A) HIT family hydrolase
MMKQSLTRTTDMNCLLCSEDLNPILDASNFWRLVLNCNQNLVGKCMLVSRHHVEMVDELGANEWDDLRLQVCRIASALRQVARPEHFNYAFLQNQDRHVHLHVIPRYASMRVVAGIEVDDPDYPNHYAVPAPDRPLDPEQTARLARLLRAAL